MDNFQTYDEEKYHNSKSKREKRNDESKRQSRNQIEQNRRNDMKGYFDELRGLLSQSNPLNNKSSYAKILQIGISNIKSQISRINQLTELVNDKNTVIYRLTQEIDDKNTVINQLTQLTQAINDKNHQLAQEIFDRNNVIYHLTQEIDDKNTVIYQLANDKNNVIHFSLDDKDDEKDLIKFEYD